MSFMLSSSDFVHDGPIPKRFTCQGADISPELQWSGAPEKTRGFVLIVDDPDAPDPAAPKMVYVHWVLYNLPASLKVLGQAIEEDALPPGTLQGLNDWKRTGYGGPCPPIGRHRYFFKLYALDTMLPNLGHPTKAQIQQAMSGNVLAEAVLMGTYEKER
jgi:Raf kinase inhibitor-like YbhB/YbcL family protein